MAWQVVGNKLISWVDEQPVSRISRVASTNFRYWGDVEYFWNFVLVICVRTSVVVAKKRREIRNDSLHGARKRVPEEIGETPGGPTIHRSINHSRFYLPSYLISLVSFFSPSLGPSRPFRDSFVSRIFQSRVFFSFTRILRLSPSRDFSSGKGFLSSGSIDQSSMKEFHGSVKILMIERHEKIFNRFLDSRILDRRFTEKPLLAQLCFPTVEKISK